MSQSTIVKADGCDGDGARPVSGRLGASPTAVAAAAALVSSCSLSGVGALEALREWSLGRKTSRWMPSKHLGRCGCTASGCVDCESRPTSSSFDRK